VKLVEIQDAVADFNADLEEMGIFDEDIIAEMYSDGANIAIDFLGVRLWDSTNYEMPEIPMKDFMKAAIKKKFEGMKHLI
jgi:hypothetical protein